MDRIDLNTYRNEGEDGDKTEGMSLQDFFGGTDKSKDFQNNISYNNNSSNLLNQLGNVFEGNYGISNVEEIKTEDVIDRKNSDAFDNLGKFIDNKDMNEKDSIREEINENSKTIKPAIPKDMDNLYSDVLYNERKPLSDFLKTNKEENIESTYIKEDEIDPVVKKVSGLSDNIEEKEEDENSLSSVLKDLKETKSSIQDNIFKSSDEKKYNDYRPKLDSQPYIENPAVEIIDKDDNINNKITSNVLKNFKKQNRKTKDTNTEKAINELNDFVVFKKKEAKKAEDNSSGNTSLTNENSSIYGYISNAYPNLSKDFIVSAYGLKEIFYNNYRRFKELIVLHRCTFRNIDKLHNFVEIVISHNYSINVDEKKMIVDVFKIFENTEGAILSNIFTIANQTQLLDGEYEGYRIISKED